MDEMAAVQWLGEWEPIECVGRHSAVCPAGFACGYKWRGAMQIDKRSKPMTLGDPMRDRVQRATPVDGTVGGRTPSWTNSPQARFWLEEPKVGMWERFVRWLKKGARE